MKINSLKENSYSITQESLIFLEKYLNTDSPSGYEVNGQKLWKSYLENYIDDIYIDIYGNVVGIINPNQKFKVVIEAHADEISWCVNYIDDNGLIYVIRNGGIDHQIAPSKKVAIHTKKGIIYGIFGWQAIHTRKLSDEKSPTIDNLYIDIGASNKEEVHKLGVHVGCIITYVKNFFILNDKFFVSKGIDNKIGGFIIAEVTKLIKNNNYKLPFTLYIINCVQEEVGLRGAKIITNKINPNIAIITDVSHDTSTPMINKKLQGDIKCGYGPVISYAPSIQNNLRDFIIKIAKKNKINFQRLASYRYTGTDTDIFAYSNGGVASALISLPIKYMHTTVEMVNKYDIEKTINLFFILLKEINPEQNFNYLI